MVYLLGDANVDVILPIDEYPEHGGDKRSESMIIESGGSAANSAVVLAQLGVAAHLIACVGEDPWAPIAKSRLNASGVEISLVQTAQSEQTGLMFIPVTPDGQRTLFGRRGANRLLQADSLPYGDLGEADGLHVSGYSFLAPDSHRSAVRAIRAAKDGGALISMDTAYEPPFQAADQIRESLADIDILILGEREAEELSGVRKDQIGPWYREKGVSTLAIKLGRQGARIHQDGETWEIPIFPVEVIDTTGAGDAFSAGILYGLLKGLSAPAAGLLASACGAAATTVWGAGGAFPGRENVESVLRAAVDSIPSNLKAPHGRLLEQM